MVFPRGDSKVANPKTKKQTMNKLMIEPTTWAEAIIAKAKACFDDAETAKPEAWERGANGDTLKWYPAANDTTLERDMLGRVKKLMRQHPLSILEAEDVANRIRRRLGNASESYSETQGDWNHYAARIVTNELRRYAHRLEAECQKRKLEVSRDGDDSRTAPNGDLIRWRERLDDQAAFAEYNRDRLQADIEEAIAAMPEDSAALVRRYYDGEGFRSIAKSLDRPVSSFLSKEWAEAKNEFRKVFSLNTRR